MGPHFHSARKTRDSPRIAVAVIPMLMLLASPSISQIQNLHECGLGPPLSSFCLVIRKAISPDAYQRT